MSEWKFAVNSKNEIRGKGLLAWYAILVDGVNSYNGKTERDYINDGLTVLTESEFDALNLEHEDSICGHWKEVTREWYEYGLNVLPPLAWYNGGFYVSEADTGDVHSFYQKLDGKYYTSLQHLHKARNEIIEDLRKAIAGGKVEDRTEDEL